VLVVLCKFQNATKPLSTFHGAASRGLNETTSLMRRNNNPIKRHLAFEQQFSGIGIGIGIGIACVRCWRRYSEVASESLAVYSSGKCCSWPKQMATGTTSS